MAVPSAKVHGKSVAIWFPLKPQSATAGTTPSVPTASLHFNLWRLSHKGQEADGSPTPDLLDIGIMVSSPTQLAEVSFYLPTEIDQSNVEDLAPKLASPELATGIFNEPLTTSNGHTGNLIFLANATTSGRHCGVFTFPATEGTISTSDLKITAEYEGTTFTITNTALATACGGLNPSDKLYFRLRVRIPKNGANTFINAAIPHDKWFTSGVDVTEYLDFRLNQARNLHKGISRHLAAVPPPGVPAPVRIERVDFLLVVGVDVDVVVGHPNFHKCRLLEKDLWKTYVDEEHLRKGMVIYHWKGDPGTSHLVDFNAFVKLRVRLSGKRIIKRYLLIGLLFAAVSGVLGNLLYDGLKRLCDAALSRISQAAASAPELPTAAQPTADSKPLAVPNGKTEENRVNGPPPPAGVNGKEGNGAKKGTQG